MSVWIDWVLHQVQCCHANWSGKVCPQFPNRTNYFHRYCNNDHLYLQRHFCVMSFNCDIRCMDIMCDNSRCKGNTFFVLELWIPLFSCFIIFISLIQCDTKHTVIHYTLIFVAYPPASLLHLKVNDICVTGGYQRLYILYVRWYVIINSGISAF